MTSRKLDYIGTLVSSVGTIVSLVSFFIPFENTLNLKFRILTVFMVVMFILMFYVFLKRLSMAEDYLRGESYLFRAQRLILNLQYDIEHATFEKCTRVFGDVCSHISKAFEEYTGRNVSVCIKYIKGDVNSNACMSTFCRDVMSRRDREVFELKNDYYFDNSDFRYIMERSEVVTDFNDLYFFSNSLPKEKAYRNSHIADPNSKKWTLPYKSTIVVPIMSTYLKKRVLYAYLCIDSSSTNAFRKEKDLPILQHMATCMCPSVQYVFDRFLTGEDI